MLKQSIQRSVELIPWPLRRSIRYIPGVAALQRAILRVFLEGQEFEHMINAGPAKGLKYPVLLPDDKGVWTGNYEVEFVSALVSAVKPGDVCLDIGGWRGYCGGAMATHGAKAVYIFEPLPDNCARIQKLIGLNTNLPLHLIQAAVGEQNGEATFSISDATSMGKLSTSPFQPDMTSAQSIKVKLVSIDDWVEQNGIAPPSVMKIDVEGAEVMALKGAEKTLKTALPTLFIECHSRELTAGCSTFLTNLGYKCITMETNREPDSHSEPEVCHLVARRR